MKAIAFTFDQKSPLLGRIWTGIRTYYFSKKFANISHAALLKSTVLTIEDILQSHDLREKFYSHKDIEIEIVTDDGFRLDIAKFSNENIIVTLFSEARFGREVFATVLNHSQGIMTGIEHMNAGFCVGIEFNEETQPLLNPEVLVNLILSKSSLRSGKISLIRTKDNSLQ